MLFIDYLKIKKTWLNWLQGAAFKPNEPYNGFFSDSFF